MLEESIGQPAAAVKAADIDMDSLLGQTKPAPPFGVQFGLNAVSAGKYAIPAGVILLDAAEATGGLALIDLLKTMEVPASMGMILGDRRTVLYRIASPELGELLAKALPEGVTLLRENDVALLPDDWTRHDGQAASIHELTELTRADIAKVGKPQPDAVVTSNPLLPYSLRGQSERFKQLALEATPLLGGVCLRGQVTIWYAGPNTGKTLFALSFAIDAVREGRIAGGNIFYINADDNGAGFATKLQIMDDIGANTLAPGFKGLRTGELIALLQKMADNDEARGVLIIIDTIKKFGSLMDKKEASAMAQAFRQVAMKGGSVLGLAHTTKSPNADGTPRYAGTSDLVDDADAVYTLKHLQNVGAAGEHVVQFDRVKSRGPSAECAAYSFTAEAVPYEELLASVQAIDPMQVDEFKRIEDQRSDAEVITAVTACIEEGINTKMLLAKEVAARINISGRAAGRIIERYTGTDPTEHRWCFNRGNRGAQVFELLPPPETQ